MNPLQEIICNLLTPMLILSISRSSFTDVQTLGPAIVLKVSPITNILLNAYLEILNAYFEILNAYLGGCLKYILVLCSKSLIVTRKLIQHCSIFAVLTMTRCSIMLGWYFFCNFLLHSLVLNIFLAPSSPCCVINYFFHLKKK